MADDQTPKKVVKRVVKRPVAAQQPSQEPTMRYGRPVGGPSAPRAASTKVAERERTTPTTTPPRPEQPASPRRPRIARPDLGAAKKRAAQAASTAATRTRRSTRIAADYVIDRWYDVRAWRIPAVEPVPATLLTGLLMGLLSVGLGVVALEIFSQVRGVASGGGRWGSLTFVVLAFVAFALGERLLVAFGTPMARLTSFLGITITIIVMLGLLLDIADSTIGLVVVPVLTALAYLCAHWLLSLAETVPSETD